MSSKTIDYVSILFMDIPTDSNLKNGSNIRNGHTGYSFLRQERLNRLNSDNDLKHIKSTKSLVDNSENKVNVTIEESSVDFAAWEKTCEDIRQERDEARQAKCKLQQEVSKLRFKSKQNHEKIEQLMNRIWSLEQDKLALVDSLREQTQTASLAQSRERLLRTENAHLMKRIKRMASIAIDVNSEYTRLPPLEILDPPTAPPPPEPRILSPGKSSIPLARSMGRNTEYDGKVRHETSLSPSQTLKSNRQKETSVDNFDRSPVIKSSGSYNSFNNLGNDQFNHPPIASSSSQTNRTTVRLHGLNMNTHACISVIASSPTHPAIAQPSYLFTKGAGPTDTFENEEQNWDPCQTDILSFERLDGEPPSTNSRYRELDRTNTLNNDLREKKTPDSPENRPFNSNYLALPSTPQSPSGNAVTTVTRVASVRSNRHSLASLTPRKNRVDSKATNDIKSNYDTLEDLRDSVALEDVLPLPIPVSPRMVMLPLPSSANSVANLHEQQSIKFSTALARIQQGNQLVSADRNLDTKSNINHPKQVFGRFTLADHTPINANLMLTSNSFDSSMMELAHQSGCLSNPLEDMTSEHRLVNRDLMQLSQTSKLEQPYLSAQESRERVARTNHSQTNTQETIAKIVDVNQLDVQGQLSIDEKSNCEKYQINSTKLALKSESDVNTEFVNPVASAITDKRSGSCLRLSGSPIRSERLGFTVENENKEEEDNFGNVMQQSRAIDEEDGAIKLLSASLSSGINQNIPALINVNKSDMNEGDITRIRHFKNNNTRLNSSHYTDHRPKNLLDYSKSSSHTPEVIHEDSELVSIQNHSELMDEDEITVLSPKKNEFEPFLNVGYFTSTLRSDLPLLESPTNQSSRRVYIGPTREERSPMSESARMTIKTANCFYEDDEENQNDVDYNSTYLGQISARYVVEEARTECIDNLKDSVRSFDPSKCIMDEKVFQ